MENTNAKGQLDMAVVAFKIMKAKMDDNERLHTTVTIIDDESINENITLIDLEI